MKIVIQRVTHASVTINKEQSASINKGLLLLLGITYDDDIKDIHWLVNKVANMRIFSDADGKMNLSVKDIQGDILVISQFTLYASTKKGNRPSFLEAAKPDMAIPLYESFIEALQSQSGLTIRTGIFGADMKVELLNDGPVTIIIDSKDRV